MAPASPRRSRDERLRPLGEAQLNDHVIDLAWTPDGKKLVAAEVSGPIHVLDLPTANATHVLSGHQFGTTAVGINPSGDLLATAGQDGKIRVWDTHFWQERGVFEGGSAWVENLAFNRDGSLLATAAGKKVRLWDVSGTMVREWTGFASTVSHLAWQPGTNTLAVACYGGVNLFTPDQEKATLSFQWKGSPLRVAWSPNGQMLAHGNQDATIHFWSMSRPTVPLQMSGYASKVRELSWDYSSRFLVTGGLPAACIWDCAGKGPEGTKPQMLAEQPDLLSAVAFQNRGFLLTTGTQDGSVGVWQPANKKQPLVGEDQHKAPVTVVRWSPNDKNLAVAWGDGTVRIYLVG